MIKVEFTEEQIKQLHHLRFNHPHPRVQLKMEVLYLKSQGLLQNENSPVGAVRESQRPSSLFSEPGIYLW